MKAIRVKVTRFISDDQPGIVECKFQNAWYIEQIVHEKGPVVSDKYLDANSDYPQAGVIACEIIKEWKDKNLRTILSVSTMKPWDIDTIDGLNEFDVLEEHLT